MAERRGSRFQEQQRKSTRQTGTDYERAAGYYLEQLGYEILEYNYRCRAGEIDLIAKDGEYLVGRGQTADDLPVRHVLSGGASHRRCAVPVRCSRNRRGGSGTY